MKEIIKLNVTIVIDHDQVSIDSKSFIEDLTTELFSICDDAEVELHVIPERKE
jgi:hypothetical protein